MAVGPPSPSVEARALTGAERRRLRALGHALDPVITVGHQGVSEALVKETRAALAAHELIKVRLGPQAGDRHEIASQLAEAAGAHLVQVLGRVVLLYAPSPDPDRQKLGLPGLPARP